MTADTLRIIGWITIKTSIIIFTLRANIVNCGYKITFNAATCGLSKSRNSIVLNATETVKRCSFTRLTIFITFLTNYLAFLIAVLTIRKFIL